MKVASCDMPTKSFVSVVAGTPTMDEVTAMREEIERLRVENEEFKKRQRPITFEINEKGGVAVHGAGRYGINLYRVQWERILEHADQLKEFIEKNKAHLN